MKRALLIDLDTPAFAASAVNEKRSIEVLYIPKQLTKTFDNRTKFKARLAELGKLDRYEIDYTIKDVQIPNHISYACFTLKSMVEGYAQAVNPDLTEYFISGKDNFRDSLELPIKYKFNREDTIRPLLLKDTREYAINKFKPMICNHEEADDAIIWRGYELLEDGYEVVLLTIDKDSFAYGGLHILNPDKLDEGVKLLPDFGSLWVEVDSKGKKKVRGNGFLWYCFQHINGDKQTDSFKPTDIVGIKFGDISAYNVLKDCKTKQETLQKVVQQFKLWYPEPVTYTDWTGKQQLKNYIEIADLYFKCCRMKVTRNDELDFVKFCNEHGVEL